MRHDMENQTIVTLLLAAIGALSGVIVLLFTLYRRQVEARIRQAERLARLLDRR